jgi:hypothetical protein
MCPDLGGRLRGRGACQSADYLLTANTIASVTTRMARMAATNPPRAPCRAGLDGLVVGATHAHLCAILGSTNDLQTNVRKLAFQQARSAQQWGLRSNGLHDHPRNTVAVGSFKTAGNCDTRGRA